MNGRCKDCKWWKVSQWDLLIENARTCELAVINHIAAIGGEHEGVNREAVKMYAEQGELITLPDFGCVMFEARE